MPKAKLLTIITALMLLAGTSGLRAEYNLAQLQEIERLVMLKDTAALGRYLALNRQVTVGEDPLARELRGFLQCVQSGQLDCFASPKVVRRLMANTGPSNPVTIY